MFQKLITYSIRHKLVIGVLSIALAIWGVWSLMHLPFDSTPDITDNQVQVITQAPSLGAQEVEQYVTTPVEMALANIPRIQERRSISRSGLSVITLAFSLKFLSVAELAYGWHIMDREVFLSFQ
jgi:heavy metal efflux system protein